MLTLDLATEIAIYRYQIEHELTRKSTRDPFFDEGAEPHPLNGKVFVGTESEYAPYRHSAPDVL